MAISPTCLLITSIVPLVLSSAPCIVFLTSDAAFDIHWVGAAGQEIPLEAALKAANSAKTQHGDP